MRDWKATKGPVSLLSHLKLNHINSQHLNNHWLTWHQLHSSLQPIISYQEKDNNKHNDGNYKNFNCIRSKETMTMSLRMLLASLIPVSLLFGCAIENTMTSGPWEVCLSLFDCIAGQLFQNPIERPPNTRMITTTTTKTKKRHNNFMPLGRLSFSLLLHCWAAFSNARLKGHQIQEW